MVSVTLKLVREAALPSQPGQLGPVNDIPQAEVEDTLRQTQARIDITRSRLSGTRSATSPHPQQLSKEAQNKRLWGSAMMDTLAEMGMPVRPTGPSPDNASHICSGRRRSLNIPGKEPLAPGGSGSCL